MSVRTWLIHKLGGFTDTESYLETLSETERHEILSLAVSKLFNTIDDHDLFKLNAKGQYTFAGVPQTKEQVEYVKQEATHFLESKLFRILDAEVKYHANVKLRLKSQTELDIMGAKLIEYTWDIVKSKLRNL